MRARAELTAAADANGRTRLTLVRSQAPLVLRPTADAVYLAAAAAGPIGGDELDLTVEIGPGACLTLRTVAATLALPAPLPHPPVTPPPPQAHTPPDHPPGMPLQAEEAPHDPAESVFRLTASVGAGGRLTVLPEPTVVAAAAQHRMVSTIDLAPGAALVLREEVTLGRHGETGGTYHGLTTVDLAGTPLLRHELVLDGTDPSTIGPAAAVGARACGSLLVVDPTWDTTNGNPGHRPTGWTRPGTAGMPLATPGLLVTAVADDTRTLRSRLSLPHAREADILS